MQVTIQKDDKAFRLFIQHTKDTEPVPAGPRLGRKNPLTISRFAFDTRGEATKAATELQSYIDREH